MNDSVGLQFVDTNILVYAYDNTQDKKYEIAAKLLESLWETGNGCLSVQVLQEFYYNITRKSASPLPPEEAALVISDFSDWIIHRPGIRDVLAAITTQIQFQISFWDAMIIRSALETNCDTLWSEDLSHGQDYGGVEVHNPFK